MKKILIIILMLIFSSCMATVDSIYQAADIVYRPPEGYNRSLLFKPYITREKPSDPAQAMCKSLKARIDWNAQSSSFRSVYPKFNIELLAINQYAGSQKFSWQERILLSDALELLTFAVNSPVFEQEMTKITFYNNDRDQVIPSDQVIKLIRNATFKVSLGKNKLPPGVLAEATIGGYPHTIWMRDDIDYLKCNVAHIAMVLGHELTHNLGFLHSSNIPHGVHNPILLAISSATQQEVDQFMVHTPHFENDFLSKVRVIQEQANYSHSHDTKDMHSDKVEKISDYESDFDFR